MNYPEFCYNLDLKKAVTCNIIAISIFIIFTVALPMIKISFLLRVSVHLN